MKHAYNIIIGAAVLLNLFTHTQELTRAPRETYNTDNIIGKPKDQDITELCVVEAQHLCTDELRVQDDAVFYGPVTIKDNLEVTCNTNVGKTLTASVLQVLDDVTIGDDLTVSGSTTIKENLDVENCITTSWLEVTDDALIGDTLTVEGDVVVEEDLTVEGDALIEGNLDVENCITTSWLEVTDDALIGDDLTVSGTATIVEDLIVNGCIFASCIEAEGIEIGEDITVDGCIFASCIEVQDANITNNLNVENCVTTSWLEVTDDALIGDDLTVSGSATIVENLDVENCVTTSWLEVTDDALIGNSLTASFVDILCDVDVGCNLNMNDTDTTGDVGVITKDGSRFIHNRGVNNTFIGKNSGNFTMSPLAGSNTVVGASTLINNTTGFSNAAVGFSALANNTTGIRNAAVGANALNSITTGDNNSVFGYQAGTNLTLADSYNICVGNEGVAGDSNVIRIGDTTTANSQVECYVAGIYDITPSLTDTQLVIIDSEGQLGTLTNSCLTISCLEVTDDALIGDNLTVSGTGTIVENLNILQTVTATAADILCDIDVGCNINMEDTNSLLSIGVITKDGSRFIHNRGTDSTFIGENSGGSSNIANTGVGTNTLQSSSGTDNTAVGTGALSTNSSGSSNTAVGRSALILNSTGDNNVAIGSTSLANNTANNNTAVGYFSLNSITTGTDNVIIGFNAGRDLLTSDSFNICIGNRGVAGDDNIIRIGDTTTANSQVECYIAGIRDITTNNMDAIDVLIDSDGQLGTVSSSKRFKENIASMNPAVVASLVSKLNPVEFNYISDKTKTRTRGLIAEEVAEVENNLVIYDKEGLISTVKYREFTALLIAALQHVMKENDLLENRVVKLEMLMKKLQSTM